jgi:hypothetical protein
MGRVLKWSTAYHQGGKAFIMSSRQMIESLFQTHYSLSQLKRYNPEEFKNSLLSRLGKVNDSMEGYAHGQFQRDLSRKFHWGHNHKFSDEWMLEGRMGDRHLDIIAAFNEVLIHPAGSAFEVHSANKRLQSSPR